jgi:hypothetical protein
MIERKRPRYASARDTSGFNATPAETRQPNAGVGSVELLRTPPLFNFGRRPCCFARVPWLPR